MQNKVFIKIVTPRLVIRPILMSDADSYFSAEQASLNELLPHWSWAKTDKSVDDIKKFIKESVEYHEKEYPSEMNFVLICKESNKFLGMAWLYGINWFVPSFEIHYWLDTRFTGNGYMTEAVNALTRTCFDLFKAKRVQICVSSQNEKSKKVAEKLNFQLEGELENYFIDFETHENNSGLLFSCCHPDDLPALNIYIDTEKKVDVFIRDISIEDFPNLDRHFGEHTIYKKPKNHWQYYFDEHENSNRIVKVVEVDNQVIGFGTLKFKSDNSYFLKNNIPEINDILIAPEFRKQGFGKMLVASLERDAREKNYSQVGLAVGLYADYGSAQRLYIKMGYVPNGLGITYRNEIVVPGDSYPIDDDALLWLTKSLSSVQP